jgi:AcrR family transcriptional regulator
MEGEQRTSRERRDGSARAGAELRPGHAGGDRRARLLAAMVEIAARDGYADARIVEIAGRARVSVATFYELFATKQECFQAAQLQLSERLTNDLGAALEDREGGAAAALLEVLADLARDEPAAFTVLTHESMLAGPGAVAARGELIIALERQVEDAWARLPADAPVPDLAPRLWIGGAIRALGFLLRRGDAVTSAVAADLIAWVDAYARPRRTRRWAAVTLDPALLPAGEPTPPASLTPAQPLPRGRHRLADEVVERVQRERIQQATSDVVRAKGYANTTVADIVAAAGTSRDAFYANFHDKRDAFLAAYKQGFEQTLVSAAEAFFTTAGDWPERVWESGRAFTRVLSSVPNLAYLGFVECYALGPAHARQVDETLLGFAVFLEDGYRYRPQAAALPRMVSEAIAGATMETAYACVRGGDVELLPGLLPTIAYTILAPFMGPSEAGDFVVGAARALYAGKR